MSKEKSKDKKIFEKKVPALFIYHGLEKKIEHDKQAVEFYNKFGGTVEYNLINEALYEKIQPVSFETHENRPTFIQSYAKVMVERYMDLMRKVDNNAKTRVLDEIQNKTIAIPKDDRKYEYVIQRFGGKSTIVKVPKTIRYNRRLTTKRSLTELQYSSNKIYYNCLRMISRIYKTNRFNKEMEDIQKYITSIHPEPVFYPIQRTAKKVEPFMIRYHGLNEGKKEIAEEWMHDLLKRATVYLNPVYDEKGKLMEKDEIIIIINNKRVKLDDVDNNMSKEEISSTIYDTVQFHAEESKLVDDFFDFDAVVDYGTMREADADAFENMKLNEFSVVKDLQEELDSVKSMREEQEQNRLLNMTMVMINSIVQTDDAKVKESKEEMARMIVDIIYRANETIPYIRLFGILNSRKNNDVYKGTITWILRTNLAAFFIVLGLKTRYSNITPVVKFPHLFYSILYNYSNVKIGEYMISNEYFKENAFENMELDLFKNGIEIWNQDYIVESTKLYIELADIDVEGGDSSGRNKLVMSINNFGNNLENKMEKVIVADRFRSKLEETVSVDPNLYIEYQLRQMYNKIEHALQYPHGTEFSTEPFTLLDKNVK